MVEEHGRLAGHQSEPTTPPEYHETTTGFPTALSRPNANRYSLSSLQTPPGMLGRSGRSGSILASPQSGVPLSRFAFDDQLPPWSQQTSRRNSDEDEKEEAVRQDPTSHRATNAYVDYFLIFIMCRYPLAFVRIRHSALLDQQPDFLALHFHHSTIATRPQIPDRRHRTADHRRQLFETQFVMPIVDQRRLVLCGLSKLGVQPSGIQ